MYLSWLLVAIVWAARAQADTDPPYCSSRYRRLCQGKGRHVACQFPFPGPGPSCVNYTLIPFGPELRHFITHYINRRRQRVAAGNERVRGGVHIPRPEIMMQVEWDRELATLAQRLADQCSFVHDDCRATIRYWYAGQTVGEVKWRRTSDSEQRDAARAIRRVFDAWWGERRRVTVQEIVRPFRLNSKGTVWGHFSQLAVWSLRGVGCGAVRHGATYPKMLLVCDFSHTNMLGQRTLTPGPLAACPIHTIRQQRSMYPLLCSPVRHPVLEDPDSVNQSDKPNEEFDFAYDASYDDGDHISDDIYDSQRPNAIASAAEISKQKAELIIKARNRQKVKEKDSQKVVYKDVVHDTPITQDNEDLRETGSRNEVYEEDRPYDRQESHDRENVSGKESATDTEERLYNSERVRDRNEENDRIRVLDRGGVLNRLKVQERVGAYDKTNVLSVNDKEKELDKIRVSNRKKVYGREKVPGREITSDSAISTKDRNYKKEEIKDENHIAGPQTRLRPDTANFVERERANKKIGQNIYQKAMDDRKLTQEEKEAVLAMNKKYPNERDFDHARAFNREEILQRGRLHGSTAQNNLDEVKIRYYVKPLHGKEHFDGVTQYPEHNQDHLRVRPVSIERDETRYSQDDMSRRERFKNKGYFGRDTTRAPMDSIIEQRRNRVSLTTTPRPISPHHTEAAANFGVVFYEPVKRRWRPTRDRPDRPGAKALLVNTMPIESGGASLFQLSTKPVVGFLKMDKDDAEQFFKDTGYNPLWKISKQVTSTITS